MWQYQSAAHLILMATPLLLMFWLIVLKSQSLIFVETIQVTDDIYEEKGNKTKL